MLRTLVLFEEEPRLSEVQAWLVHHRYEEMVLLLHLVSHPPHLKPLEHNEDRPRRGGSLQTEDNYHIEVNSFQSMMIRQKLKKTENTVGLAVRTFHLLLE